MINHVATAHIDPLASVIFWGTFLLLCGIIGRFIATRCHQPGVLGELAMGILVGNVGYFLGLPLAIVLRDSSEVFQSVMLTLHDGNLIDAIQKSVVNVDERRLLWSILSGDQGETWIKIAYIVDTFSRFGVIFLLFMVGLESSVEELKHTGKASLRVALLGVIAPMTLGLLILYVFMPQLAFQSILFVSATLSATSVGITARVLKDMRKLHTAEAKTILGAAMIDDILGLILLAIVSGVVLSGKIDVWVVVQLLGFAGLFLSLSLWLGPYVTRFLARWLSFMEPLEAKLLTIVSFVMILAWLAAQAQLATMIGAFVAGLIMHESLFINDTQKSSQVIGIKHLIAPFEAVCAPLFFIFIGLQVKLETFLNLNVLWLASLLTIAAVVGKLISGYAAPRKHDRALIGIGMLPRGEVGLVFAAMGKSIGVISDSLFSAIIIMVIVTTVIVPPWLKWRYKKQSL